MKVSLRWLADYVDLPTSDPDEIARALDDLGHEVEGIERLAPSFEGVLVGRVETVEAHPDADKVRLTTVDTGDGPTDVVCGAWNFEAGAIVPVARPGAVLMDGSFPITERAIRGVTSNGMICSAKELGLGEDADGIMVLDDGFEVGTDFADHLEMPDAVIDLSITPNRPDAMSMIGIARELAAHFGIDWRMPDTSPMPGDGTSALTIEIDDDRCPRFTGREVRGVEMGPSPLWMQLRLERAGVRAISNVVDVSNYVMLELGQPTHAFDFDRVAGARIVVRSGHEGEKLTTLDGVERLLGPEDIVVADDEHGSSLGGTMGGEDSEVSTSTTNVLVEVASWDPPTILRQSRRHALRSEASARYERGVDVAMPIPANHRMVRLLAETAGGAPVGELVVTETVPFVPATIRLPLSLVERTLGVALPAEEIIDHLTPLGVEATATDDEVVAVQPSWRPDLTRPIDLVEEVARLRGYATFESSTPSGAGGGLSTEQVRERRLRAALTGLGLSEAKTFSFHGHGALDALGLDADDPRQSAIEVRNPLREEESLLRTTLLPGLLDAARFNVAHGVGDVALFEIGRVFLDEEAPEFGTVPEQPAVLGFVLVGASGSSGVGSNRRPVDAFSGVGLVRALAASIGMGAVGVESIDQRPLHPGRGARVLRDDGLEFGVVGELHPKAARAWGLPGRVVVGELTVAPMLQDPGMWLFVEPSLQPHADFDLAFVLPDSVSAAAVVEAIAAVDGATESVVPFDLYRGPGVRDGQHSLAVRIRLRAADRTLTSDEVAEMRDRCIESVRQLGGTLRGAE